MPYKFNPFTGKLDLVNDPVLKSVSLLDGGHFDVAASTSGWGEVFVGDNEERARFSWTAGGVVTLMENTANVVSTDTGSKFCIFNGGAGSVRIRNRLGATKVVKYVLNY